MEKINAETVVSSSELAPVLGISIRRVQQFIQDGTFLTISKGKYKLCDCVHRYISFVTKDITTDAEAESLKLKSEARYKQAKASMAEMDEKERAGTMHRSEDVASMTADLIFSIRSALMALPGRLAVDVLAAKNSAEASEIIRDEVYKVMEELSNYEYDPAKYQERVRERLRLEAMNVIEEEVPQNKKSLKKEVKKTTNKKATKKKGK